MAIQLLAVLSAAALAAAGLSTPSETRSAQSLPAQDLALAQVPMPATGKIHSLRHLTNASSDPMDQGRCERGGGRWDVSHQRCRKPGGWWDDAGVRLLIAGGAVAGIAIAVSESESNHHSISN